MIYVRIYYFIVFIARLARTHVYIHISNLKKIITIIIYLLIIVMIIKIRYNDTNVLALSILITFTANERRNNSMFSVKMASLCPSDSYYS